MLTYFMYANYFLCNRISVVHYLKLKVKNGFKAQKTFKDSSKISNSYHKITLKY